MEQNKRSGRKRKYAKMLDSLSPLKDNEERNCGIIITTVLCNVMFTHGNDIK